VYLAEATGDTGFASPAVFEVVKLVGNQLVLAGNTRTALSSFVATSVASGTRAYATSGDAGSLFMLDPALFTVTSSIPLHDARWSRSAAARSRWCKARRESCPFTTRAT